MLACLAIIVLILLVMFTWPYLKQHLGAEKEGYRPRRGHRLWASPGYYWSKPYWGWWGYPEYPYAYYRRQSPYGYY